MTKRSSLYDQPNSFGWISIALHWSTALAIAALWLIGKSISFQDIEAMDTRRSLHITLGLLLWLPLAGRIAWRLYTPHPHAAGQSALTHQLARTAHYLLLVLIGIMLVSGPLLAWYLPERTAPVDMLLLVHASTSTLLAILVGLHVFAALKHFMFHDDETVARIFMPRQNQHD